MGRHQKPKPTGEYRDCMKCRKRFEKLYEYNTICPVCMKANDQTRFHSSHPVPKSMFRRGV